MKKDTNIIKQTLKIFNLYSRMFQTTKYQQHFSNVPVERLTYYPELHEMYVTVGIKGEDGPSTYTARIPENLMKVVAAHGSNGRRIAFFTNDEHVMGHVFFGEESHNTVRIEINKGIRPKGWCDPTSKDFNTWKEKQREIRGLEATEDTWAYAQCLEGVPPYLGFKEDRD